MPPEHFEAAGDTSRNRVERLANNFATAVLMPAEIVGSAEGWGGCRLGRVDCPAELLGRRAAGHLLRVAVALDQGHVSVRRAAALVGLPVEGLAELFAAHGVEHAIDL